MHNVHLPPPCPFLLGEGVEPPTKFSKGGRNLTGSQFLEGACWETKMFFFVITKNLTWEISTKNLVTFKRWEGLRMKNLNIMRVHWKIQFLGEKGGGGGSWKTNIWGELPKKGGAWMLGQFADLRGGLMCIDCENSHHFVSSLIVYFNDVCVIQFSGSELCIWHFGGIPSFKKS